MAKSATSLRIPDDLLASIDTYASERSLTRTAAILQLLSQALKDKDATGSHTETYDVLLENNLHLREQVSQLWAQIGQMNDQLREKDKQLERQDTKIEESNRLLAQAQAVQGLLIQRALPERTGIWNRITSWLHPQHKEED